MKFGSAVSLLFRTLFFQFSRLGRANADTECPRQLDVWELNVDGRMDDDGAVTPDLFRPRRPPIDSRGVITGGGEGE